MIPRMRGIWSEDGAGGVCWLVEGYVLFFRLGATVWLAPEMISNMALQGSAVIGEA